jgi:hypothetical protein
VKSGRCIHKSKGHNKPFKRTIAGMESGFPFFTISDLNKVIGVAKVDFSEYAGFLWGIEEV